MSSVKRIIEKLCADGRVAGVIIPTVELMPSIFRQLCEEVGADERVTQISLATCNGMTTVERR